MYTNALKTKKKFKMFYYCYLQVISQVKQTQGTRDLKYYHTEMHYGNLIYTLLTQLCRNSQRFVTHLRGSLRKFSRFMDF